MFIPLLEVLGYSLDDADLLTKGGEQALIWRVSTPCVVVGQSNRVLESLDLQALARDKVPVYRRPSGGQPVFLSPGTVQISVLLREPVLTNPRHHFEGVNTVIQRFVADQLGVELQPRGISDLATGDGRKVLGSSIYRSQGWVLYHGVLNLTESPVQIARYLLHPPAEPDYRGGRSHMDFITSLAEQAPAFDRDAFFTTLTRLGVQLFFGSGAFLGSRSNPSP